MFKQIDRVKVEPLSVYKADGAKAHANKFFESRQSLDRADLHEKWLDFALI